MIGEIAAAYASGLISTAEAIGIAFARGEVVSRNTKKGQVLAVSLSVEAVAPFLADCQKIVVACYNSPQSITLSGDYDTISALKETLDVRGVFSRILATDRNAYHSHHMQPLGASYEEKLDALLGILRLKADGAKLATSRFVSSVNNTGGTKESVDVRYWRKNLELPVMFSQAVTSIAEITDILIEIGPHACHRFGLSQALPGGL